MSWQTIHRYGLQVLHAGKARHVDLPIGNRVTVWKPCKGAGRPLDFWKIVAVITCNTAKLLKSFQLCEQDFSSLLLQTSQ